MFLLISFSPPTAILINWWSSALLVLVWSQYWLTIRHLKDKIKFVAATLVGFFSDFFTFDTGTIQFATVGQIASDQRSSESNLQALSGYRSPLKWLFSNFLLDISLSLKFKRFTTKSSGASRTSPKSGFERQPLRNSEEASCY